MTRDEARAAAGAAAHRGSGWPGVPIDRNPGAAERLPPARRPETRTQRLTAAAWNLGWETARRLPEGLAFLVADVAGLVAWRRSGQRRRAGGRPSPRARLTANLARVVGPAELDAAVRSAYRSYARYWVESFRAADLDPSDIVARTESRGFHHLDAVLDEGNGAVVLLAHHGSWDVAARWGESCGYHLAVVAEVVRPRKLFEKFVRLRESVGLEVVPLVARREGMSSVTGRLVEVLAANHIAGLLSDRDLTGKAPVVDLFGEAVRLPVGPVVLSRRTGAPIIPITMLQRPGRRWYIEALPAIRAAEGSLEEGCAAMAAAIEQLIRLDPAQWHAFQPMFLADLPGAGGGQPR